MRREIAIISVTKNGRITIPEEIRKATGIVDGDKIKVEIEEDEVDKKIIVLTKL